MSKPFGDLLFDIAIIILLITWIGGWIILIVASLTQKIFPTSDTIVEKFLQVISAPLSIIQKYALIIVVILFFMRLIIGWLGWAPPLILLEE